MYPIISKKRRKRKTIRFFFYLITGLLLLTLLLFISGKIKTSLNANNFSHNGTSAPSPALNHSNTSLPIHLKTLNSPYSILIEKESGNISAEQNSQQRIYPASLTKIMTAILAIESISDLSQSIILPEDIFSSLYTAEASMAGFLPGETAVVKDLVYGVLLPSGAECCLALADIVAGSESAFIEQMNAKAEQLGMNNTYFSNSTGLHEENHYSTAEDIAILLKYALENKDFRTAFTSRHYTTDPSNCHPDGFTFYSTAFHYLDMTDTVENRILGGKTGYTEKAGLCLASLLLVNGKEFILVTAGANGTPQTESFHLLDAINVCNQLEE